MAKNNSSLGRGLASLIPRKKNIIKPIFHESGEDNRAVMDELSLSQGRSKEALLEKEASQEDINRSISVLKQSALQNEFLEVPIRKVALNPQQPRHDFDNKELEELAASIKEHGIIQPLVVTKIAPEQYELIAGERRLKAARMAGLEMVPVIVREGEGEKEKLEIALIENIQRKDLNVIEEARAYKKLSEEFDLTQEEIARRVGRSRSAIANKVRLLNLPVEIQRALIEEKITEGHARSILALENPEKQRALFELILAQNLTVRQTEDKIREVTVSTHKRRIGGTSVDPIFKEKEEQIAQALGTKVTIKKSGTGGKILIDFYSSEELENIVRKLA